MLLSQHPDSRESTSPTSWTDGDDIGKTTRLTIADCKTSRKVIGAVFVQVELGLYYSLLGSTALGRRIQEVPSPTVRVDQDSGRWRLSSQIESRGVQTVEYVLGIAFNTIIELLKINIRCSATSQTCPHTFLYALGASSSPIS
jgi:hypothetical protein